MFRGTTPTFRFAFKEDISKVTKAMATFACNRDVLVRKSLEDMLVDGTELIVQLSQEETLKFPSNSTIEVQLAIGIDPAVPGGKTLVGRSQIYKIPSERILEEDPL